MTKPTGRPRGRPRKPLIEHSPAVKKSRRHVAIMGKVFKLTEAEMETITPREIFRRLAKVAMMARDDEMLLRVVRDWGPYEHARKSETVTLTPEELRRIATAAKSEASRRGLVIDIAERRSVGAV